MSKLSIENVTLGADPEVFLVRINDEKEEFIPSLGIIPGDKWDPHPISDKGHFILKDNVAAEFCIPPCQNKEQFAEEINFVMEYLRKTIPAELSLSSKASAEFEKKYLNNKFNRTFGCMAEFSAHTMSMIAPPDARGNLRTTGGRQ